MEETLIGKVINGLADAQRVLQSEMALRSLLIPKGKNEAGILHTNLIILMQKFKLFYAQLFHATRKIFGRTKNIISEILPLTFYDHTKFKRLITKDDPAFFEFFKKNCKFNLENESPEIIDAITFSFIPTYFNFFILESRSKRYIKFMESILNKNEDLFVLFSRSAFLSPAFINFVKESFDVISDYFSFSGEIEKIAAKLMDTISENIALIPSYVRNLFKIATPDIQKRLLKECLCDIIKIDKRLFTLDYWYNPQNESIIQEESNKILDEFLLKYTDSFISLILKSDYNYEEFMVDDSDISEHPSLFKEIHNTRLIDSFDEIILNSYDKEKHKFRAQHIEFNFSQYVISRTIRDDDYCFGNQMKSDKTMFLFDRNLKNLREVLKFSPPLPNALSINYKYPFNLEEFLLHNMYIGNPKDYIILSENIQKLDKFKIINNQQDANDLLNTLKSIYVSYEQTRIFISKTKNLQKSIQQSNYFCQTIFSQIRSLSFSAYVELYLPKFESKHSIEEILRHPALLFFDARDSLIPKLPTLFTSNLSSKFIQEYIIHICYRKIPYFSFRNYRRELISADNQMSYLLADNYRFVDELFFVGKDVKYKPILQSISQTHEFSKCVDQFNKVLDRNSDPLQKHLELYNVINSYQMIIKNHGYEMDTDMIPIFYGFFIIKASSSKLFSNLVYLSDFLFPFNFIRNLSNFIKDSGFYLLILSMDNQMIRYHFKTHDGHLLAFKSLNLDLFSTSILLFDEYKSTRYHTPLNFNDFLNSEKFDITFYVCGDDHSIANQFIEEYFGIKIDLISTQKIFTLPLQKLAQTINAEIKFVRIENSDEIKDKKIDSDFILNFSYQPSSDANKCKESFKNARKYDIKSPIYYYDNSAAREAIKNLNKDKDQIYNFVPVEKNFLKKVFDERFKAMDINSFIRADILYGLEKGKPLEVVPIITQYFSV